jgi:hypothetical protein
MYGINCKTNKKKLPVTGDRGMTSSSSRFVIPTDPGDPATIVFIDDSFVVAGTIMGKIWVYNIADDTRCLYVGFSDDAVRGVYVEDGALYATIGDQYCKVLRLKDPLDQLETKFDRRSGSSGFRYVFQKFNQVTIIYPGMTTFVDVVSNDQNMCPFKMQQSNVLNVIPLDSFHYYLLLSEFPASMTGDDVVHETRRLRVVDVSVGETIYSFPNSSVTFARLIDKKHLVFVDNRQQVTIYNFKDNNTVISIPNFHKTDIVAMDSVFHLRLATSEDVETAAPHRRRSSTSSSSVNFPTVRTLITSVSSDGTIFTWDYTNGKIHYFGKLASFCFSLGFPYHVVTNWNDADQKISVAITHDYGVSIVNLASSTSK